MSCRVALLRMARDELVTLPPPRHLPQKCRSRPITAATNPQTPITAPAEALADLHLKVVTHKDQSALWREYIQRYHYLGYSPLPGAQLRYMALSGGRPWPCWALAQRPGRLLLGTASSAGTIDNDKSASI